MIEFVIDVSLPPAWVDILTRHGWPSVHWSSVGDPRAKDRAIMAWAREHRRVVFTHDLDFGTALALTRASGPSVIQVRTHDVMPEHLEEIVVAAIRAFEPHLQQGAIATVDEVRRKVRVLPIGSTKG